MQPNLTASGADNGVVRLWHDRALRGRSTALVPAGGAAVCGVDFCGEDANLLVAACADSCAYVFDLRNRCVGLQPSMVMVVMSRSWRTPRLLCFSEGWWTVHGSSRRHAASCEV